MATILSSHLLRVKNSRGKQNRLSLSNTNKTQVTDFATSPDFSTVLKEPTLLVTGQDKV